jgi:hypothetical protein
MYSSICISTCRTSASRVGAAHTASAPAPHVLQACRPSAFLECDAHPHPRRLPLHIPLSGAAPPHLAPTLHVPILPAPHIPIPPAPHLLRARCSLLRVQRAPNLCIPGEGWSGHGVQALGSVLLRRRMSASRGVHPFFTRAGSVSCLAAACEEWRSATCGGKVGVKVEAAVACRRSAESTDARKRVGWSGGRLPGAARCGKGRSGHGGQVVGSTDPRCFSSPTRTVC